MLGAMSCQKVEPGTFSRPVLRLDLLRTSNSNVRVCAHAIDIQDPRRVAAGINDEHGCLCKQMRLSSLVCSFSPEPKASPGLPLSKAAAACHAMHDIVILKGKGFTSGLVILGVSPYVEACQADASAHLDG